MARVRPAPRLLLAAVLAALVAALLATVGCDRAPEDRLVSHLESMVELMEKHKEAPDSAAEAVEQYVQENLDELQQLRSALDEERQTLTPAEVGDLAGELLLKSGPVMERAHRLMRDAPSLAANERLRKALRTVSAPR